MTPRRTTAIAGRRWPRRTVRLRLTIWYGGLLLVSAIALIAVTYALVVQAFTGNSADNALCAAPAVGCHAIGAQQARAIAVQDHSAVLHQLVSRSLLALVIVVLLSVGLGWVSAGRALRPLRTMSATARQISAASLSERLDIPGPPDELTDLADTIDDLLARLEAAFSAQRQFIANAAHELRTPLARQRVISQVALADPESSIEKLRHAHERVLASGAEQSQLIDALLTLARGQAGLDVREPFDLADLTCKALASRQPEAELRNLTVHASLAPAAAVGSPQLAGHLVANLVDNALRYNLPGGHVDIGTDTRGGQAVLVVTNTGPVVPAAEIERLFRPFQRLAADRTSGRDGLGLGLAIVQAIAAAHQAVVTARARPGGGLQIAVAFPASPADAVGAGPSAEVLLP